MFSKSFRNTTVVTMLTWYLFIIQLVVSNADLKCSFHEHPRCYELFIRSRDYEYCSGNNKTMECMKKMSIECVEVDSNPDLVVPGMITCQPVKERNETSPQIKPCGFAWGGEAPTDHCYWVPKLLVLEYRISQDNETSNLLHCDSDYVGQPSYINIKETKSGKFYNNIFAPTIERVNNYCNPTPIAEETTTPGIDVFPGTTPSGATSLDFRWILIAVQASTILFAHMISSLGT